MNYVDNLSRGDVFDINLDPTKGAEIGKTRPAVVIQNNLGNKFSPITIIASITGAENIEKPYPVMVFVKAGEGGLIKDSYIDCGQIRSIDKEARLVRKLGILDEDTMSKVDKALKLSLALN